jgi:hypothetical protein
MALKLHHWYREHSPVMERTIRGSRLGSVPDGGADPVPPLH